MTTAPISRRTFLAGAGAACAAGFAAPLLRPQFAFSSDGVVDHTLVVVLLEGGLDGLSALVPAGDRDYARHRKHILVPEGQAIGVSPMFALHPALAPLHDFWTDGLIAAVPAVGSPSVSRSHFEAMATMASGVGGRAGDGTGWLARHLRTRAGGGAVTLHGVSTSAIPPLELAGHPGAFNVPDLASAGLRGFPPDLLPAAEQALRSAYAAAPAGLAEPSGVAFSALDRLRASGAAELASAAGYGDSPIDNQLRQVAQLIRADIGMEAAVVSSQGWDTHRHQTSQLTTLFDRLSRALASFMADMASQLDRTTVVVVSEFGRRVWENASGGTDHGRGGLALVMGRGINGGVHGTWPGLDDESLQRGDLTVTTDLRSVLAEVLRNRVGNPAIDKVFPRFSPTPVGFA